MKLSKLIITIPEDKYKYIKRLEQGNTDYATTRMLYHAVKNGMPLDKIRAEIQNLRNCSCNCLDGIIDDAPTVIEADKESET